MPSILNDIQKETVKRTIPKQANRILAVAVARLYAAYPHNWKWTYTGLEGAIALLSDNVEHTFRLKLVDVSNANRGVLWEQEIYETWDYNIDGPRFHTFEIEKCMAGLSFADEKEAKQFHKKMRRRGDSATKKINGTPFIHQAIEYSIFDEFDPDWRERFGNELLAMGITDGNLHANQTFIIEYLKKDKQQRGET